MKFLMAVEGLLMAHLYCTHSEYLRELMGLSSEMDGVIWYQEVSMCVTGNTAQFEKSILFGIQYLIKALKSLNVNFGQSL